LLLNIQESATAWQRSQAHQQAFYALVKYHRDMDTWLKKQTNEDS